MKYLSYVFGGLSAAGAAFYLVLYLYRWEWQRALISGMLLLVVEMFLVCVVVLTRMARLERRMLEADARNEEVRRRLEQSREPSAERFRWIGAEELDGTQRTFVFVPVLMVAGATLSGIAWVVQKVAGATARPGAERRLAGRLTALTAPPLGARSGAMELEDRPVVLPSRPLRAVVTVTVAVAALVALALLVDRLADATQTRSQAGPNSAASTVVFQVEVRGDQSPTNRDLAANDLWDSCRRSTAAPNYKASLGHLKDQVYAGVVTPALPPHDLMRLRGCIADANTNRTKAKVIGEGQAARR